MTIKVDRRLNRSKAETVRRFVAIYGKCDPLTRKEGRWTFRFALDGRRRKTIMAWIILQLPVEVSSK